MAKYKLNGVGGRHAEISQLIHEGKVSSQASLTKLLKARGYDITQATVSRDLEELGAIRHRDADGVLRYHLGGEGPIAQKSSASASLIHTMQASGNLVVIGTPPGGAQLLASALDAAMKQGVIKALIGTIAGDDTVLAISKSAQGGNSLAKELAAFSEGTQLKFSSRSASKSRTRARK